jgi:hypothetical protein
VEYRYDVSEDAVDKRVVFELDVALELEVELLLSIRRIVVQIQVMLLMLVE